MTTLLVLHVGVIGHHVPSAPSQPPPLTPSQLASARASTPNLFVISVVLLLIRVHVVAVTTILVLHVGVIAHHVHHNTCLACRCDWTPCSSCSLPALARLPLCPNLQLLGGRIAAQIGTAQGICVISCCTYPIVYLFPMFGFFAGAAVVSIQLSYCLSDISSKCGAGLVI